MNINLIVIAVVFILVEFAHVFNFIFVWLLLCRLRLNLACPDLDLVLGVNDRTPNVRINFILKMGCSNAYGRYCGITR